MGILLVARHEGIYNEGVLWLLPKTVFPLLTGMWWYPTSYALFLIFLPFASHGLQNIGRRNHRILVIWVLLIWGLLALIPFPSMQLDLSDHGVFVFLYWFIIISYCRWYLSIQSKEATLLILSGLAVEFVYWGAATVFFEMTGKKPDFQNFIFDHWKLPTMMIGFGLFVLCCQHPFHSRFVNYLAASSFGVYLIHYQPGIYRTWTDWFPLKEAYMSAHPILDGALIILIVFSVCLVLDLIRQTLFRGTIDQHSGKWFEKIYSRIEAKVSGARRARHSRISPTVEEGQ